MAEHDMSQRQLKSLLLLLVFGPLIPTVLFIRFMLLSVETEREQLHERQARDLRNTLALATRSLERQWDGPSKNDEATARKAADFYNELVGTEAMVSIIDEKGGVLAGRPRVEMEAAGSASLSRIVPGWQVRIYPADTAQAGGPLAEQIRSYAVIAVLLVVANLTIAGAAAWAVHRKVRLQELRNTTLATLSHELRTPVASMRVLIDTLAENRTRSPEQAREYIGLLARETGRLGRLVENLLTFSRVEHGTFALRPEPVAPSTLANAAVESLHALLAGCDFQQNIAPDLPDVRADRDAMVGVLANLLENAVRHGGGRPAITLAVEKRGECVVFSVSDNGPGIPVSERAKIFAPFYQSDDRLSRCAQGCGLGLAIVKEVVTRHGGTVRVESEAGGGSVFSVTLPTE